jgi:hypothetical protein
MPSLSARPRQPRLLSAPIAATHKLIATTAMPIGYTIILALMSSTDCFLKKRLHPVKFRPIMFYFSSQGTYLPLAEEECEKSSSIANLQNF